MILCSVRLPATLAMSLIAAILVSGDVRAQDDAHGIGRQACILESARLPEDVVDAFLQNPRGLLLVYPDGGSAMIERVRELVGTDARAIEAVVVLGGGANPLQQDAIGRGLAAAARDCLPANQEVAVKIQARVADLGTGLIFAAFQDAANDVQTADLGSARGLASGGGGLPGFSGLANGGSGGEGGNAAFPTSTPSFSIRGGGGFTTSSANDVSPVDF